VIEARTRDDSQISILVVQPNRSLSWRGNVLLACSLGAVTVSIGAAFALQGYWLVLPFAGVEAVALFCAFYCVARRLSVREVITIGRHAIRVERGRYRPESKVEINRYWSRLRYHLPESPFETGDLQLRCQGRTVALGLMLGREEMKELHQLLCRALAA